MTYEVTETIKFGADATTPSDGIATLHQALTERGFSSRPGTISGKREIYNNLSGEIIGEFDSAEAWNWIGYRHDVPASASFRRIRHQWIYAHRQHADYTCRS